MKPELHLFIIWSKARYIEDKVLKDIRHNFEVVDLFDLRWSRSLFSNNLSRFYGETLPVGSHKERHCGIEPFRVVIVNDMHPVYDERETSKGLKRVNVNLFDAKSRYRSWSGGGHKIHATNDPKETHHDLAMLLGMDAQVYFDGDIGQTEMRCIDRDIVGSDGWRSISELFYVLNHTITYVVLRNFESLPDNYTMETHGDIDLLVDRFKEIIHITNATKVYKARYRVHHRVKIGDEFVRFDFRYVGDNYYDELWEKKILERRKIHVEGFYIPTTKDYFYSLLYHGLVHKRFLANDYRERLVGLASEIDLQGIDLDFFERADAAKKLLNDYLKQQGYTITEPEDLSVYFNEEIVGRKRMSFQRRTYMDIKKLIRKLKHPIGLIKTAIRKIRDIIMRLKVKTIGH